jgi:aspartate kinase
VYGDARILPTSDQTLRERYTNDPAVHLVPGFVARSRAGEITTLGRGGTDYSATYLGAVLGATTTLFKDTAGLLTSNPQIVEAPRRIERLHYLDALELAHYGTEAIADKAIVPAMEAGTAIEIRGFRNPEVRSRIDGGEADVLAVTCVRRAVMLDFLGLKGDMLRTLGVLFHSLADIGTYPLLVTEASPRGETSMVLKEADLPRLRRRLEDGRIKETPEITREVSVVSMIGSHMRGRVGMAASIFDCLATHRINILAIAQTASERNVSITVTRSHVDEAVCALHERFIGQAG